MEQIKISVTGRGSGYYIDPKTEEFVEIQPDKINKALHGDIVEIRRLPDHINDKPQAEVLKVISRSRETFVGYIEKQSSEQARLIPDDRRVYVTFYLSPEDSKKVEANQKVQVRMTDWSHQDPDASLVQIIGMKGEHEVEMKSILLEKGIIADFKPSIITEAQNLQKKWSPIPQDEYAKRRDMRDTTTFTIDPLTAKDFDDALSIKKIKDDMYEIGVHIADVSHFVTPGSQLDLEAKGRAFSVYLVDRTIPMLPEILSNDICSLNPNEDRLAFSVVFHINMKGEVSDTWYGKTVIHSDKRYTYEEAQEILDKKEGLFFDELNTLNTISKNLGIEKFKNGAIRFSSDEFEFVLDEFMFPIAVKKKEHIETHSLIEEFMLLANKSVAKYIYEQDKKVNGGKAVGLMYRVHNSPDIDKLQELVVFLKAIGYKLELKPDGTVDPKEINKLLKEVDGKPEENLISSATIKTMSKALYSTENLGHFGLAFDYYTHFTSPIRRYPDLIVHRMLAYFLSKKEIPENELSELSEIAAHSSAQEINAAEAERESIRYKQIEYMSQHVGKEYKGIVSGVAKWGLFVQIEENGAEGLVHISKLGEDYFKFTEKEYKIYGEKTGKSYRLGDEVMVKVDGVSLEEKKLDLGLVTEK
jgi:ribonuclease R